MKPVLLGMSGGVDSCAAAVLLEKTGYSVTGMTLILRDGMQEDINRAKAAAQALGIEHRTLDLREKFREKVVADFISEYSHGRTPNPCVQCNINIKFGAMLDYALENGFSAVATGHYAKTQPCPDGITLNKCASQKDQSYFLYGLSTFQLEHTVFPLSEITSKDEVRAVCAEAGLEAASHKDSEEICFIPDDDYVAFLLKSGVKSKPGNFVDRAGNIIGTHQGLIRYTVGQRKGLGAFGKPMFVTSLDPQTNSVILGENGEQYADGLIADKLNLISFTPGDTPLRAQIKVRFRARPEDALITFTENGFRAIFDKPVRSVTPGQGAAIYIGERCIGGGRIINQLNINK